VFFVLFVVKKKNVFIGIEMARVALRIYNHEIESLIAQGHIDEAIAHCRHILKTFPKHLETYRLLGKAYLEARRYNEAIDILGRLLMAVPDDFAAHVCLSIIRDEENKLDDAIWHMERAFEVQTSNAAIQSELQRLYGKRDGMEPPKIQMTRGALARVYVQGELYPQAIAEIRGVLTDDDQRADMQVLLALAYFKSGQKSDASDLCHQLLKRYPYAFDANRIMVELLPVTAGVESTQVYRMRVSEMDPYSNFVKGSIFQSDEAPDASINLEKLEYKGEDVPMGQDWGSKMGIDLGASAIPALVSSSNIFDEQPEWLKEAGFSDNNPIITPTDEATPPSSWMPDAQPQPNEDIPDFLRAAGWGESNTPEQPTSFFDEDPADNADLVAADIPEWLKGQQPNNEISALQQPDSNESAFETPDWLKSLGSSEPVSEPIQTNAEISSDVPDWLNELGGAQSMPQNVNNIEDDDRDSDSTLQPTNLPDWLQQAEPKQEAQAFPASVESLGASSQEQDDAVAWLESLAAKHGAKPEELVTDPNKRNETPPEWVAQAQNIGSQPSTLNLEPKPNVENLGATSQEQDDAVAWLESLAAKHGAKPEELVTDPNKRNETPPEWVAQAQAIGTQPEKQEPAKNEAVENALNIGEQFFAEFEKGTDEPADTTNDDWFKELEEKAKQNEASSNAPDWNNLETQPETTATDLPNWLSDVEEKNTNTTEKLMNTGSLSDWLSGLDDEPGLDIDPEILRATPQASISSQPVAEPAKNNVPDWLSSLDEEKEPEQDAWIPHSASTPTLTPASAVETESLPDWLSSMDETPDQTDDDLPPWLHREQYENDGTPVQPKPTAPTDWQPVIAEPKQQKQEIPAPSLNATPVAEKKKVKQPPVRAKKAEGQLPATGMLTQAKSELERGDIPEALLHYGKLIKRGKNLEEIIRDLSDSLYRYPVEVNIWQALGDAYMRANRLKEALDAYNKAEELIR
jgi:tetratricopeptide (TPR) repeat protein